MSPRARAESIPVFRHLVGTYRRISDFDDLGFAELWFRIRRGPRRGLHWVAIEPALLRRPGSNPSGRRLSRGAAG